MILPPLTLRDVTLRPVVVPLKRPLVTRIVTIENIALLLIDVHTEEGVTGRAYLWGFTPRGAGYLAGLIEDIVASCVGDAVVPETLFAKARKGLTMLGHQGMTLIAISGFDLACWDALAQAAGQPLAILLGGRTDPIPAYNSTGLGIVEADAAADEALALLAEGGYEAIKIRLGRDDFADDLATLRAVRRAVGDDVLVPCDFNQCLDLPEALKRSRALDDEGVYWIEEPIVYDDFAGCAELARAVATPIQIGENFYGPEDLARALAVGACDYVMPDAQRIGGVTGWMRAAALAEAADTPMSSHLFPEFSRHLLAATPTAHWLEFVDWASPVLAEPATVVNGHLPISATPGAGISWNEDAVARYTTSV